MTAGKQRIAAFDIMKGIAILLVIVGHCQLLPRWVPQWIYSFHMPLFFIIAGWFFKPSTDIKTFSKKSIQRLLVPYLATALLLVLYNAFSAFKYSDWEILKDQVIALVFPTGIARPWMWKYITGPADIGPIWFLLALFWCRFFFNWLLSKKVPLWGILIIAGGATILDNYVISLPFALLPGLSAMVFFAIGHYFASRHIPWWLAAICIFAWPFAFVFSHLSMNRCIYHIYPLDVLGACGGTLCMWYLSRLMETGLPLCAKAFKWLGQVSLTILCVHTVLKNCYILDHLHLPEIWYVQLPVEITAIMIITWICSRIPVTQKVFGMS